MSIVFEILKSNKKKMSACVQVHLQEVLTRKTEAERTLAVLQENKRALERHIEEQIAVINQCQGAVAILERVAADITLEKTDKKMCEKVTTNYSFDKKE